MAEHTTPMHLDQTLTDPEVFGMEHVLDIGGDAVATHHTEDELRAIADDPEQARLGFVPNSETGGKDPVMIAGEGILIADRRHVRVYVDRQFQLGYILGPRAEEAGFAPEAGVAVVDAPAARRHGGALLSAIGAKLMPKRIETFGTDPDAVQTPGRISVIDPYEGTVKYIRTAPDHLNSGRQ